VYSTTVETRATARAIRVLGRTKVGELIKQAEVFACRDIAGTSYWSDHSWGAAVDLFPAGLAAMHAERRRKIAHAAVYQATHRTRPNRFRKLAVRYVIDHDARAIWTPAQGWHPYTGTTGDHVHVSTGKAPSGTPPCAR